MHGRNGKCIQNLVGNLKGRDHSEDLGVDGRIMVLQCILGNYDGKVWTGCISLRIGTNGGLL
jgi:hypothetical protein